MAEEVMTPAADVDAYEQAMAALDRVPMIRESRPLIQLKVEGGVATLSGIVLSQIMHRAVLYYVAATPGINKIVDYLFEDSQIEIEVAKALAADLTLKERQPDISVTSYLGAVTLSGAKLGEAERSKATEIAARASGVREVITHLG